MKPVNLSQPSAHSNPLPASAEVEKKAPAKPAAFDVKSLRAGDTLENRELYKEAGALTINGKLIDANIRILESERNWMRLYLTKRKNDQIIEPPFASVKIEYRNISNLSTYPGSSYTSVLKRNIAEEPVLIGECSGASIKELYDIKILSTVDKKDTKPD